MTDFYTHESLRFLPLFPSATQLDTDFDIITKEVMKADKALANASYSYQLALEYLAENRYNQNNFKSIQIGRASCRERVYAPV